MKKNNTKIQVSPQTTQIKRNLNYLQLSHQDYLIRTLKLIGVTEAEYLQETKNSFKKDIFPKTILNPSNSKPFFFIVITCMKHLAVGQDFQSLKMWYAPKNVNEQIEFKKVLLKLIQKLQIQGFLPKDLIISKAAIMGDSPTCTVVEFLRILSELSLRSLYIQKYSMKEKLIQLSLHEEIDGNDYSINKFYRYPFVQNKTATEPPLKNIEMLENVRMIYMVYIERYKKNILSLRTAQPQDSDIISPQSIMSKIIQQKELAHKLHSKVAQQIFSENRAFDRRILIDKHQQIWKEVNSISCDFIQTNQANVLKVEGEIDKVLHRWTPVSGHSKVIEFHQNCERINALKKACQVKILEFKKIALEMKGKMKMKE